MLKIIIEPSESEYDSLCQRPLLQYHNLHNIVEDIFLNVQKYRDQAVMDYTRKFDKTIPENVNPIFTKNSGSENVTGELKNAIQTAHKNIQKFHSAQQPEELTVQTMDGVICRQKAVPIQKIGLYIPGGSAPLFSTVLMLAIPAKIAGCKEIVLCTPPDRSGQIHPAILYAAQLCGIGRIFPIGGAQAIAAMTFGTETIPKVDKIFGPGNQYVTYAKQYSQQFGVAIDMPAGPSEVLVFADTSAVPEFVAADLLAQAEHGADSQVILVANSTAFVNQVNIALEVQAKKLPRYDIIQKSMQHSKALIFENNFKAFGFINQYAPEHLIIASETPEEYESLIHNAGSVFMGNYCPESAGDYASGTNHTLPTNGWARSCSGVNLDAFYKKITFQTINQHGILNLSKSIINMAQAEFLEGHAQAVKIRLKSL